MKYLDVHTHSLRSDLARSSQILSIDLRLPTSKSQYSNGPFSLGIHPWFIDSIDLDSSLKKINNAFKQNNYHALGEIGLDRAIKVPYEKQVEIFKTQVSMAMNNKASVLIIHCVRAFQDIMEIIKHSGFKNKIIFHDYNGGQETTRQLIKAFDENCYFSFGKKVFQQQTKGFRSLEIIPLTQLFLETDHSTILIEEIYEQAALLYKVSLDQLQRVIIENSKDVFSGKSFAL